MAEDEKKRVKEMVTLGKRGCSCSLVVSDSCFGYLIWMPKDLKCYLNNLKSYCTKMYNRDV